MAVVYKGKHAELCKAIASGSKDDALELIYSFFRSEENTDSYSIVLLTMVREMLEDNDSDALYQMRIRMRSQGDRVLINIAQFMSAFEAGGFDEAAETLAGKCCAEAPKLARSMQEYADEEGLSQATQMAGLRVREAMKLICDYFKRAGDKKSYDKCIETSLDMTRVFLFQHSEFVAEDMLLALKSALRRKDEERSIKLSCEIISNFADKLSEFKVGIDSDEVIACVTALKYAYEFLNQHEPDHPYQQELEEIQESI